MGGQQSAPEPELTREQLVQMSIQRKLYSRVDLRCFLENFNELADTTTTAASLAPPPQTQGGAGNPGPPPATVVKYLRMDTLARFLGIPDALGAGPIVFQLAIHAGAFPYMGDAPVPLGFGQLTTAVALLTPRHKDLLDHPMQDQAKIIFGGLAVRDELLTESEAGHQQHHVGGGRRSKDDDRSSAPLDPLCGVLGSDGDDFALTSLVKLSLDDAGTAGGKPSPAAHLTPSLIPSESLRRLAVLLLLVAPLTPPTTISQLVALLGPDDLVGLNRAADAVVAAMTNDGRVPFIKYRTFARIVGTNFPHMFEGLGTLFSRFTYREQLTFEHDGEKDVFVIPVPHQQQQQPGGPDKDGAVPPPTLLARGEILTHAVLSQLSFFLPGSSLFGRLHPLYSGAAHGFSIMNFEHKVFNWRAPTILLVRGSRLPEEPVSRPEAAFASALPPKRFPPGCKDTHTSSSSPHDGDTVSGKKLTFGVYVTQPWRHTHHECFGDAETVLFQLEPVFDVFRSRSSAAAAGADYVSFPKSPVTTPYLAVGCPHPGPPSRRISSGGSSQPMRSLSSSTSSSSGSRFRLGPVSLLLDGSFEHGVFSHDFATAPAGPFTTSAARPGLGFEDRFAIEALEVWGCGGAAEAKTQADRWEFERREAEARRRINLGTGDIEADRALLEMAGLVGANRSGGSMS
jgi:hypothetical protein